MSQLQPPRGTHDLLPENYRKHLYITQSFRDSASCFGFQEISTPIFEFSEVFERTLGESSDIVNKEMYTFKDRSGESMTLRPEGTAPIARAFMTHGLSRQAPLKFFYEGPMFRYERPQKGRQRQFHQLGVELIGASSVLADIECISLAHMALNRLGLMDSIQLDINSLGTTQCRQNYREQLVSYLQQHQSRLSKDSQKRLTTNPLRILDSKDDTDKKIIEKAPQLKEYFNDESKVIFDQVCEGLLQLGISFSINPKLVRGLDYYCHSVFEFRSNQLGSQDAVLSGGRYDQLISTMGGPETPGVGWAAGLERLSLLIDHIPQPKKPIAIVPLGKEAEKAALEISYQLRAKNLYVEMAYSGNLAKRMKKANKAQASHALIIGDNELRKGYGTLKNLETGDQSEVHLSDTDQLLKSL